MLQICAITQRAWIRILRLEPGLATDPIHCVLRPVRCRDAEGTYVAVSYAWGTEQVVQSIIIDGKTLDIRKNLYTFVHSVRAPDRPI
jgi:hypothetical protein